MKYRNEAHQGNAEINGGNRFTGDAVSFASVAVGFESDAVGGANILIKKDGRRG